MTDRVVWHVVKQYAAKLGLPAASEIRKYVAIANQLHGDLVVVTGYFVTYDPAIQAAVVQAVSALKAPFGLLGCLGNHEYMTGTEESITAF
jgi:uncharacterized protein